MTTAMVDAREPTHSRNSSDWHPVLLPVELVCLRVLKLIGHSEVHPCVEMRGAYPHAVALNEREDFLVGNGVHVANHRELLLTLHKPCDIFAEQRKGRVSDNDVSLVSKGGHLVATEVSVTVEIVPREVVNVDDAVA